jgi:hypothetical protein
MASDFSSREVMFKIYKEAVKEKYKFFSYGDSICLSYSDTPWQISLTSYMYLTTLPGTVLVFLVKENLRENSNFLYI